MRKFVWMVMGPVLGMMCGGAAFAQQTYPTAAGGVRVQGVVPLQCNSSGAACGPVTASNPAGPSQVVGDSAAGATDSNTAPVKLGCKYAASYTALTDGQRGNVACNQSGNPLVSIGGAPVVISDATTVNMTLGNNAATPSASLIPTVLPQVWNGSSIAVQRGDTNGMVVQYGLGQWNYSSGITGILSNTTVAVTFKAAAGASVRNFIDSCQIITTAFTTSVPLAIRDGAGGAVLWAAQVPAAGFLQPVPIVFTTPLRGTANTLLEAVTTTANTTGTVMLNCQGHTGN